MFLFFFFLMKNLFFTSTRPKHPYKTEKFFRYFLKLRHKSSFGRPGFNSNFKRMFILKKFFMWHYNFLSNKTFKNKFAKVFLLKQIKLRTLVLFFNYLERLLPVLLVRLHYTNNLDHAQVLVRSGFVYVNGLCRSQVTFLTQMGDIIEVFSWQYQYSMWARCFFLFVEKFYSLRKLLNPKFIRIYNVHPRTLKFPYSVLNPKIRRQRVKKFVKFSKKLIKYQQKLKMLLRTK